MPNDRPDPDKLLQQIQQQSAASARGKLKIFFGYAAGVGKTFAMLQAARIARDGGREIVLGYVEPHGRKETEALLEGFEAIPTRSINYRGVTLREFDVDSALHRRPDILVVDELAHTNAEGSRHSKRWQDVIELLDAGINVWTTLNVQHLESLNDVIGQVTGIVVRETIPDSVFDQADELELADLPPEDLLKRLKDGKVYVSTQAQHALSSFFQKTNLVALRELSLRQTAKRVHSDVELARGQHSDRSWAVTDRILVCVGPSPTTARVIRTAKRMAAALDCNWSAVCVDRTNAASKVASANTHIAENLRLAERLGAETVVLTGDNVVESILDYARTLNVTKIFIGKTHQPKWRRWLGQGIVDQLLERAGDLDVYVIQGEAEGTPAKRIANSRPMSLNWQGYLVAMVIVLLAYLISVAMRRYSVAEANLVMTFLFAVAIVAFQLGRGPAILASVLSVLTFDIAFVEPIGRITVSDTQYLFTFSIMLGVSLLISTLTARLRSQLAIGKERERRTLSLNRLSKQLAAISGDTFLVSAAASHLLEMIGGEVAIYLKRGGVESDPRLFFGEKSSIATHPVSLPAANWVTEHDQVAGKGTDTLPNATALFIPVTGSQSTLGAIAISRESIETLLQSEQRLWLESCANQLALALERDRLSVEAADARVHSETERLRNTLLSGLSHDLKTPLAVIAGASSTLLEWGHSNAAANSDLPAITAYSANTDPSANTELLQSIHDEAIHLNYLIENVLQISRIDSGALKPNMQWHFFDEIVGAAVGRAKSVLAKHELILSIPGDLPLVRCDGLLIDQVLQNLLENAARYTPRGSQITILVQKGIRELMVTVRDQGPGVRMGTEQQVFERFYRQSPDSDSCRGSGLGLAICKAIIDLHQGTISVKNREGGGADFSFTLPMTEVPPTVPID